MVFRESRLEGAVVEMSIEQLVAWLQYEAAMNDSFGTTRTGERLRLAASVIADMERFINTRISGMEAEVRRLETEVAKVNV